MAAYQQHTVDNQPLATLHFFNQKFCLVTIRQLSIHENVGMSFWWSDVFPDQLGSWNRAWIWLTQMIIYIVDEQNKSTDGFFGKLGLEERTELEISYQKYLLDQLKTVPSLS